MSRRTYRLLALLLLVPLLLTGLSRVARGGELEDKLAEFDRIQAEIDRKSAALDANKAQQKRLLTEISTLDRSIRTTEKELDSIEARLKMTGKQLAEATTALHDAEVRLGERSDLLSRRISFIYEHGTVSYLQVLLNSTSFSDFLERLNMLRQIVAGDASLLLQVKQEREDYAAKKVLYEQRKAEYEELLAETETKKKGLEVKVAEREGKLSLLAKDAKQLEASIDDLNDMSDIIEQALKKLSGTGGSHTDRSQIKMMWPVSGRITSEYGNRYHPILHKWKLHTGVDLAASSGTRIAAAEDGIVITATYLSGYGNTVMIDHGVGVVTLYAHQSKIAVKKGDKVRKNDLIGYVGSTGYSTGPHLHFEIRVDGATINPATSKWLPTR